jgi:2-phosphosulfolactate phosphatase
MKIEVILTPAELPSLAKRDLRETACVVFDVLRATSTFVTALHNGARAIIPVGEISEALAIKKGQPEVLLAGERDGVKIRAAQNGSMDFDFGNSPREFTSEKIRDRTIVSTTTNGTRALRACANAKIVLAASFLNLDATAKFLQRHNLPNVLIICAGTGENAALEDILAAGALSNLFVGELSDSARIARSALICTRANWAEAISQSENARRLLAIPELRDDVAFCARQNIFNLVAKLELDGAVRIVP